HTRFSRDWSSDVCSSDLLDSLKVIGCQIDPQRHAVTLEYLLHQLGCEEAPLRQQCLVRTDPGQRQWTLFRQRMLRRHDEPHVVEDRKERRVGKGWGCRRE